MNAAEPSGRSFGLQVLAHDDGKERKSGGRRKIEQMAIEEFLEEIGREESALDVPAGTGARIGLYEQRGRALAGVDVSGRMLEAVRSGSTEPGSPAGSRPGDVRRIGFPSRWFDLVVCLGVPTRVDRDELDATVKELSRVSRRNVVVGVTCRPPLLRAPFRALARFLRHQAARTLARLRRDGSGARPLLPAEGSLIASFDRAGLRIHKSRVVDGRQAAGPVSIVYWLRKKGLRQ